MKFANRTLRKAEWEKVIQEEANTSLSKALLIHLWVICFMKTLKENWKTFKETNDKDSSKNLSLDHKHLRHAPNETIIQYLAVSIQYLNHTWSQ